MMFNFIKNKRRKRFIANVGRGESSVMLPDMHNLGLVTIILDRVDDLAAFDSEVKSLLHNETTFYLFMDSSSVVASGDGYSSAVIQSSDWSFSGMLRDERKKELLSIGESALLLNICDKNSVEADYLACLLPSSYKVVVNVKGGEVYDLMLYIGAMGHRCDGIKAICKYLLMLNGYSNTELVL